MKLVLVLALLLNLSSSAPIPFLGGLFNPIKKIMSIPKQIMSLPGKLLGGGGSTKSPPIPFKPPSPPEEPKPDPVPPVGLTSEELGSIIGSLGGINGAGGDALAELFASQKKDTAEAEPVAIPTPSEPKPASSPVKGVFGGIMSLLNRVF